MVASDIVAKPVRAVGGFYGMALDTFVLMFKPPFAWREFILQAWFVARVSIVPTLMLTIPYTVLLTFTFNILLTEFGAADFSGTGAALGTVRQIGPIVTVLVVAGAGATAMCADLGARTIREELDALRVMGINPIQALVVPRVLAATVVSLALSATVILVGLAGAYFFCVYIQHVSPGAFAAGLTLIIGGTRRDDRVGEGGVVRAFGRPDRLLQGHLRGRRPGRCRQRGERDRGVHVHGVVRDQCRRNRRRGKGDAMTAQQTERSRRPIDRRFPRLARRFDGWVGGWNRVGSRRSSTAPRCATFLTSSPTTGSRLLRIIAQMGLGAGALVVIGGTVAIVGFLTVTTGALVAVQGYTDFSEIGVEALTGFASAFFNVRLIAPATTAIALAATIGAGATAQLGAMRINDEIDALEVMGIRSVAFLASTRVIAGLVVVIPLYCVGVLASFWAARFGTTVFYGQSTGVYDHYFRTFLNPTDLIWSFVQSIAMAVAIMLIHTYYGFTASGGPAGVGEAVGRAVRTSLIISAFVVMMISLAVYGQSGNFNLAG